MKKIIVSLLTISLLFTSFGLANAQSETGLSNRAEKTEATRGRRTQEIVARISAKVDQRLARYQEFSNKLQVKRTMLSEEGADVTELDRLIRIANSNLVATQADVTEMKAIFRGLDYTKPTGELISVVRTEVQEIRQSFRTLHQSIVEVVVEISSLSN